MDSFLRKKIQNSNAEEFDGLALQVFRWQYNNNVLYRQFADLLGKMPDKINQVYEIPFLPISFFKSHTVSTGTFIPETIFSSSGTTGATTSKHILKSKDWYDQNTLMGFQHFYGPLDNWRILALLPSYLEREGSSLVHMTDYFIRLTAKNGSGFFLHDIDGLITQLKSPFRGKTLLLGVSFALLDLAEYVGKIRLGNTIVMETGGMKGRRKEITREELHRDLTKAFGVTNIHSEYGMTELLSQAYSRGNGQFFPSATMKVLIRETTDPFSYCPKGRAGAVNIIDLANLDSCSFIATDDLGKVNENDSFQILGRMDLSDVRGCNLMVE